MRLSSRIWENIFVFDSDSPIIEESYKLFYVTLRPLGADQTEASR